LSKVNQAQTLQALSSWPYYHSLCMSGILSKIIPY